MLNIHQRQLKPLLMHTINITGKQGGGVNSTNEIFQSVFFWLQKPILMLNIG